MEDVDDDDNLHCIYICEDRRWQGRLKPQDLQARSAS